MRQISSFLVAIAAVAGRLASPNDLGARRSAEAAPQQPTLLRGGGSVHSPFRLKGSRSASMIEGVDLSFSDLSFTVKDGMKTILFNCSGHATRGRLLAIMGPSGGGKTTLLNALSGNVKASKGASLKGTLLCNGEQCGGSWANRINSALELAPMATVVAFIMIDIGSAAILFSILMALNIRVPSDFALAYTVCKGALRVPRLALDASGAALLARLWPSLASIRVSLMIDAATRGGTSLRQRLFPASAAQASETRSKAMDTVRQLTDRYGLAYMAAKNVIGPVSILLLYVALRTTGGAEGLMGRFGSSANGVGLLASRLALASTASTLLFPGVVMGAAVLGPTLDQARKNAVSLLYSGKTRSEQ